MEKLIVIIACFIFSFQTFAQETTDSSAIHITLENIKNKKGLIAINLFQKKDGFPSDYKKANANYTFEIDTIPKTLILENIAIGTYAVSVLHDENSNYKLDTNFFRKPKEGYAVSNNARPGKFGPPKFEKALFTHSTEGTKMVLTIRY